MKKNFIVVMAALVMAMALVAGCAGGGEPEASATPTPAASASTQPEETAQAEPTDSAQPTEEATEPSVGAIQLTDMSGRNITLEKPATKIVGVTPADCEILYALGAGDTLVGRGEYCDYPAEVADVQPVDSGADLNVETIISLEPEAVLMSTMDHSMDVIEQMENAGITVITTQSTNIDGVYEAIALIGAVVGKDAEAEQLVADMKAGFDEVAAGALEEGKTIYFEVSPLEYGLWTAGKNTFMDEIAAMLGLENIFADVEGWAEVSEEQVLERDPDYIVTITMFMGEGPKPEEEIAARSGWDGVTAVKDGNIFVANSDELSRPGPRLVDGAKSLLEFVTK